MWLRLLMNNIYFIKKGNIGAIKSHKKNLFKKIFEFYLTFITIICQNISINKEKNYVKT